ncbi:MAG TPA: lysophospholipid acyltransferase family protein [Ramlibacter sp.]|nr:lysophospholipid acyltransferase family protein [Ramlibacter sp.]
MAERIGAAWRVLATGLCFACFGIGGLLLGIVLFPFMRLCIRDARQRARAAKAVIHHLFRFFIGLMRSMGVLTYEVRGLARLQPGGQLILANHPTLIDVVFLMAFIGRADCIVKGALARNPFTRGPVRAAGFVFNDSGSGLVEDCVNSVRAGNNLIIFPEGTRSAQDGPLRLHRGAARVALLGEVDIVPVRIQCTPATLSKGDKWYSVPARRAHFDIEVCEPIPVAQFSADGEHPALAARRLTAHLTDYFSMGNHCAST